MIAIQNIQQKTYYVIANEEWRLCEGVCCPRVSIKKGANKFANELANTYTE